MKFLIQPFYNFPRIEWTNIIQMIDNYIVSTYMRILLIGILGWQHSEVCILAVVTHVTSLGSNLLSACTGQALTCTLKVIEMVIFRIPESVNAMSSRKKIMLCSAEIACSTSIPCVLEAEFYEIAET
ncbi:uncharacterized protein [Typha latifolia]|uniref:uncharacterized protein n=1 Tax=Typha latifolia TaxID=4733 RepID=UPI003C2D8318